MVKTFVNGQEVEVKGTIRSSHDALEQERKLVALEEENKWLVAIIKKFSDESYDNDAFRAVMEGLALPEHIKSKLGYMTEEQLKELENKKAEESKEDVSQSKEKTRIRK